MADGLWEELLAKLHDETIVVLSQHHVRLKTALETFRAEHAAVLKGERPPSLDGFAAGSVVPAAETDGAEALAEGPGVRGSISSIMPMELEASFVERPSSPGGRPQQFQSEGEKVRRRNSESWRLSTLRQDSALGLAAVTVNFSLAQAGTSPLGRLKGFVEGWVFQLITALCVVAFVFLNGTETEYIAHHGRSTMTFWVLHIVLNGCFALELLLRALALGPRELFLRAPDRSWNVLDLVLIVFAVADLIAQLSQLALTNFASLRLLRIIRMFRLVRIIKLFKLMQSVREVRKIFLLIATSMKTLAWALFSVFFVIYVFSIMLCQAVTDELQDARASELPLERQLDEDFGSIGRTMYSLYTATTQGRNWDSFVAPLHEVSWLHSAAFVAFVSFSFFGVLNIITSVFVDCAFQTSQRHRELLVEERKASEKGHVEHMRSIFLELDSDGSGLLDQEEFKQRLASSRTLKDYFRALDLNVTDTLTLFELLDLNEDGHVSIDEFCDGCMRLKGHASAFDMNWLIHQNRAMHGALMKSLKQVNGHIDRLSLLSAANAEARARPARPSSGSRPEAQEASLSTAASSELKDWNPTRWQSFSSPDPPCTMPSGKNHGGL